MLLADAGDQASVDAVVKQAKVVIACAGPYAKIGTPVVDACVRLGAHYVDLTGDTSTSPYPSMAAPRHTCATSSGM